MKKLKFDLYSPWISGALFLLAIPFLAVESMALFLVAFVFSFRIKTALTPTGKRYIPFISSEKVAYEHRGKLRSYRGQLAFFYWLLLAIGTWLLVADICSLPVSG